MFTFDASNITKKNDFDLFVETQRDISTEKERNYLISI